jgi:hypothetical protein
MAVLFDAVTPIGNDVATPIGGNHTIGAATTNRVVYVCAGVRASAGPTWLTGVTATYDSVSMTLIKNYTGVNGYTQLIVFRLVNPPTGTKAASMAWTGGGADYMGLQIISFSGAKQSAPERTIFFADDSDHNPSVGTITITDGLNGDCLVDFGLLEPASAGALTEPTGATLRDTNAVHDYCTAKLYTEAVTVDGSQTQTFSMAGTGRIMHIGFAIASSIEGYPKIIVS